MGAGEKSKNLPRMRFPFLRFEQHDRQILIPAECFGFDLHRKISPVSERLEFLRSEIETREFPENILQRNHICPFCNVWKHGIINGPLSRLRPSGGYGGQAYSCASQCTQVRTKFEDLSQIMRE